MKSEVRELLNQILKSGLKTKTIKNGIMIFPNDGSRPIPFHAVHHNTSNAGDIRKFKSRIEKYLKD